MAPKRWAKPNQKAPPSAGGGSAGGAGGDSANTAALLQYICGEIRENNCLGLPEEELTGMATELMNVKTRSEVMDWGKTLMLSDAFSNEVIKRREQTGPAFEGETVKNPPTSAAAAPAATGGTLDLTKRSNTNSAGGKRNKRGVNINQLPKTSAAVEALKPGQFECGCFATVHNLRSSCANCGRIICEQEGDDVCYACGLDPSRCIAFEISLQEGKLSEAAQQSNRADYEQAVERRDRLLEYASNRAKRTTVIDDQSATLFSPQSAWMSPEERKAAEKSAAEQERQHNIELMHRQRGAYQVHMEFVAQNLPLGSRKENAGSADAAAAAEAADRANEEAAAAADDGAEVPTGAEPLPSLLQKIWYSPDGALVEAAARPKKAKAGEERSHPDANLPAEAGASVPLTSKPTQRRFDEVSRRVQQNYFEDDVEVFAEVAGEAERAQLVFAPQALLEDEDEGDGDGLEGASASPPVVQPPSLESGSRFAVTAVMRSTDDGVCLSMHQPWASLLVAGIKRHEGRVWGTNYRGRLWIHAASAQPINVEEVEGHYSQFMAPGQVFPRHYPTKVLIGYVYVTDCLDREAYEAAFKPEERQEESPFSFICVEPKALLFPLPMTGNHKLFTLEHRVHVAAKKQLGEIE